MYIYIYHDSAAAGRSTFECYNAGTAIATGTLGVSGILSDPRAAELVKFVMRENDNTG